MEQAGLNAAATPINLTGRGPTPALRYRLGVRLGVLARALAAILGGYALASAATVLLSLSLPLARVDAVAIGTLLSFVVYTCAVLWVFAARSALRAWLGLGLAGALLAAPAYALQHFSASLA